MKSKKNLIYYKKLHRSLLSLLKMLLAKITMQISMSLFDMDYNLLQKQYDRICQLFIDGKINYKDLELYEKEYYNRKHLFIINLN